VLKMAALSASVECTHYSHEFCTENVRYAESNGLSANAPPLLSLTHFGTRNFLGEVRSDHGSLLGLILIHIKK